MRDKIKLFKELIDKSNKIALYSHIRMDPDTFWSSTALYYILEKIWKDVILLNDDQEPEEFKFLWANNIIKSDYDLNDFDPDLIISLDAASPEQLGNSYKNNIDIIKKKDFLVIDHHITNTWFWTLNIINTKSSSNCELLFDILEQIDFIKYIDKNKVLFSLYFFLLEKNKNIFIKDKKINQNIKFVLNS